ncbi:MAG: hypothetical protein AB8B69_24970 [Chitinophagales bacterium]
MFRAVLLLFLILAGVIVAWLPNDVFEEDVINKYRADQAAMNQEPFEESESTPNAETLKIASNSSAQSQSTPKANTYSNNLVSNNQASNSGKIPLSSTIEQRSERETSFVAPPVDKRTHHPLYELFEETSVGSQFYDIDNQQNTTLTSNGGALINIPSNCFMQQDGSMVVGNVKVEIKELESKSEHLLSNITTNTFNSLLSSDGLIYVNAYADEQALKITPKKLIYVELPTQTRNGDRRAFFAEFGQNGQSWWSKSLPQVNRMIALPLKQMTFGEMDLDKSVQEHLLQPKFEQTFVATRAFEDRLQMLQNHKDLFPIEELVKIYTHYIDADLKESDSKVAYYFSKLAKEQKENPVFAKKLQRLASQFKHFAAERYTKPLHLTPYGVNLSESDAYGQLVANGMSSFTANMYLQMNTCRTHLMAARNKQIPQLKRKSQAKNTFMVHHTGWFSINEFLAKDTPKRNLMAQINSDNDPKATLYLVLDDHNTIVAAKKDAQGNYNFNSLPLGTNGHLVALSYKHDQPYLDIQAITVGEKHLHSLQMRPTTIEMMQYEISQLDYASQLSASL